MGPWLGVLGLWIPTETRVPPRALPCRVRAAAMSRHSLTPSAATDRHGICERRSLCYIVPSRPCLKLTGKPPDCHLPESSQAIEGMHDFAVSARVPGRRPVLYRGAGLADGLDDVPGGAGWDAAPSHSAAPCPSVVPTLAVPFKSMPGRGGARNRADRRTLAISKTAARALIEATLFAEAAGMPFNRFTTIHWQAACVADGLLASRQFLKRLANLTRSNGGRFACIWIRENGDSKGEHVHILWHGPNDLPKLGRWIRATLKTCGATRRRGVCLTRPLGRTLLQAFTGGVDYAENLDRLLSYVLKGADASARESLNLSRCEPGGELVGKRTGVSENIGQTARARGC